jgi:hypothetical protein
MRDPNNPRTCLSCQEPYTGHVCPFCRDDDEPWDRDKNPWVNERGPAYCGAGPTQSRWSK